MAEVQPTQSGKSVFVPKALNNSRIYLWFSMNPEGLGVQEWGNNQQPSTEPHAGTLMRELMVMRYLSPKKVWVNTTEDQPWANTAPSSCKQSHAFLQCQRNTCPNWLIWSSKKTSIFKSFISQPHTVKQEKMKAGAKQQSLTTWEHLNFLLSHWGHTTAPIPMWCCS